MNQFNARRDTGDETKTCHLPQAPNEKGATVTYTGVRRDSGKTNCGKWDSGNWDSGNWDNGNWDNGMSREATTPNSRLTRMPSGSEQLHVDT